MSSPFAAALPRHAVLSVATHWRYERSLLRLTEIHRRRTQTPIADSPIEQIRSAAQVSVHQHGAQGPGNRHEAAGKPVRLLIARACQLNGIRAFHVRPLYSGHVLNIVYLYCKLPLRGGHRTSSHVISSALSSVSPRTGIKLVRSLNGICILTELEVGYALGY